MLRSTAMKLKRKILRMAAVRKNVVAPHCLHVGPGSVLSASNRLTLGRNCYIGKGCTIQINGQIGNGVLVANNVGIVGRIDHEYRVPGIMVRDGIWIEESDYLQRELSNSISIEDDVWIGYGSILLGGISVGRGAVIAAGSLVLSDVLPYDIVGGRPAKRITQRFSGDADAINQHNSALDEKYR